MTTNARSLFGLSVGEKVRYSANIEKDYDKHLHNAEGIITDINYMTAEFYVKLKNQNVNYAFSRNELIRVNEKLDNIPFEGILLGSKEMSIGQMRNYLINYHFFKEGKDFSVSEKENFKEVFLKPNKYSQLVGDLITLQEVTEKFTEEKIGYSMRYKLRSEIINGTCLTLFFNQASWTFRTQIDYSLMYESILKYYGVDLNA